MRDNINFSTVQLVGVKQNDSAADPQVYRGKVGGKIVIDMFFAEKSSRDFSIRKDKTWFFRLDTRSIKCGKIWSDSNHTLTILKFFYLLFPSHLDNLIFISLLSHPFDVAIEKENV